MANYYTPLDQLVDRPLALYLETKLDQLDTAIKAVNDLIAALEAGGITNAMLAGAIAYGKLALANSIVNADIANAAAIGYPKLALSNSIVTGDIVDGTLLLTDFASGVAATSYTPTLAGATTAGTQTYNTQVGRYARIGPLVFVTFYIALTAKDAATAGNIYISLPVTAANISNLYGIGAIEFGSVDLSAGYSTLIWRADPNTTHGTLIQSGDNIGEIAVAPAAIGATVSLLGSMVYFAA